MRAGRWVHPVRRSSSSTRQRRTPRGPRPTGVAIEKPAFGLSSRTPGVASAWRPRNPGGREERERDQHETGVAIPSRGDVGDVGECDADRSGQQHDPEVARDGAPTPCRARGEREGAPGRGVAARRRGGPPTARHPAVPAPSLEPVLPWWQDTTGSKATAGPASSGRDRPRPIHARPEPRTARAPAAARALDAVDPGRRRAGRGAADAVRAVRLCRAVDASCRVRTGGSDPRARGPHGHPGDPPAGDDPYRLAAGVLGICARRTRRPPRPVAADVRADDRGRGGGPRRGGRSTPGATRRTGPRT